MSRALDDLCPLLLPTATAFLARMIELKRPVVLIDTLRTRAEQEKYLERGSSWTVRSKHLAQIACPRCGHLPNSEEQRGRSHALDVAPYQDYERANGKLIEIKLNWDADDPVWETVAYEGELLGLTSGKRWSTPDCAHLELRLDYMGAG
jgi:hypothetical protein